MPSAHEVTRSARRFIAQEHPDHTLQATALIDELYVRPVDCKHVSWQDRKHFYAVCDGVGPRYARRLVLTRKIRELSSRRSHPLVHSVVSGHFPVPGP